MTEKESTTTTETLSESERAAMFASSAPSDRNVKRRGGRAPIPPKAVAWALVAFVVLGLGGAAGEHYFGNFGVTSSTSSKFLPSNANLTPVSSLNSLSIDELMDLKEIDNATAPGFTLRTQRGHVWKLRRTDDKVVVLTFENVICNDICPVLGSEVKQAQALLGKNAAKVEFAFVNTDPRELRVVAHPLALSETGLATAPNVVFLSGSLHVMNTVWTNYGVRIKVGAKQNEVSHNNVMYFISFSGQLVAQATPFANESSSGVFSLKADLISRFAKGIATTADSLVK
jgi:cytochrome oxidase Cu insertion factor (SCO1/SenC/PrrC family)